MMAMCFNDGCIGERGGHDKEADGTAEKMGVSGGRHGNGRETNQ